MRAITKGLTTNTTHNLNKEVRKTFTIKAGLDIIVYNMGLKKPPINATQNVRKISCKNIYSKPNQDN